MTPILRKVRAISVSRTARVFVDGGASIGISVMFGLSSLPNGYRFQKARVPTVQRSLRSPKWLTRLAERLLPRHADILCSDIEHRIGGGEEEDRFAVDKTPDPPRARDAIEASLLARYPLNFQPLSPLDIPGIVSKTSIFATGRPVSSSARAYSRSGFHRSCLISWIE